MSHFSVLVVTAGKPTDEALAAVLQPWHEFECTGHDDAFVQTLDITADTRAEYETDTTRRVRSPDGTLASPYGGEFYRDPTPEEQEHIGPLAGTGGGRGLSWTSRDWGDERGYRTKVRFVPEGSEEIDVPFREVMTFREFVAYQHGAKQEVPFGREPDLSGPHKYGYTLLTHDGGVFKVIRRTNPNKRWDWWSVGGRWSGLLAPAYDPHTDPENFETCWLCQGTGKRSDLEVANGCNACGGTGRKLKHASDWRDVGNQARIGLLDLERLRAAAGALAGETYDRRRAAIGDHPIPDFDALVAERGMKEGREAYWASPIWPPLRAIREFFLDKEDVAELRGPRESAVERGRRNAIATFAVVRDGQWFERGSMGWWGAVSDEKDRDAWAREMNAMLDGLSPDAWLTVIDCHI